MALLLPKPASKQDITWLKNLALSPYTQNFTPVVENFTFQEIQTTFVMALNTYFQVFNPFQPLFSEQRFYSKPRSPTLVKIIIQIGLQHMQPTELSTAAIVENGLTIDDFTNLPPCLDSLQCLLLGTLSVWIPNMEKVRTRAWLSINSLVSLLGLNVIPSSSPLWLESTLAKYMAHLGFHYHSIGQYIQTCLPLSLYEINLNQSNPSLSLINNSHLIATQAIYNSFQILVNANKAFLQTSTLR